MAATLVHYFRGKCLDRCSIYYHSELRGRFGMKVELAYGQEPPRTGAAWASPWAAVRYGHETRRLEISLETFQDFHRCVMVHR